MQYRQLGSSGLRVSVLAFGAWQIGDAAYWGPDSEADDRAAVDAAIEAGINVFDTAEMYGGGESERVLGRLLRGKRDQVYVASKVLSNHCAPEEVRRACEASLQRLGTDWIDLYQVHWPARDVPFEATYEAMARLKQEGKIREIGVSNFGRLDLEAWLAHGQCVSNQLGYNLAFRAIEHEIVPACLRREVGILVYMPLLQGILTYRWKSADEIPPLRRRTRHFAPNRSGVRHGEAGCESLLFDTLARLDELAAKLGQPLANVALAWLIAQLGITSVVVGARNPAQLARNVAAADLKLDEATLQRIGEITQPLKEQLGPNPDMWDSGEDARIR